MKNILIHGFNVKDPNNSVGKFAKYVKNPYMWNYGWKGLLGVLFSNKKLATKLAKEFEGQEINIIAHSNGAAIAVEAARQGLIINKLIVLMPALKTDTYFPTTIDSVYAFYTKHDIPTMAARWLDRIPFIAPFIPNAWGAMGALGPEGNDPKVHALPAHSARGHSAIFNIERFGKMVGKLTEG